MIHHANAINDHDLKYSAILFYFASFECACGRFLQRMYFVHYICLRAASCVLTAVVFDSYYANILPADRRHAWFLIQADTSVCGLAWCLARVRGLSRIKSRLAP